MKSLTLLRHAKSSLNDHAIRDFDRSLNPRGRRAARTIGEKMKAEGMAFDLVLASQARRVVETIEEVEDSFGPLGPHYDERIYLASCATLLEIVHCADDRAGRLLLAGHNPGLEALALQLTRRNGGTLRNELEAKFPTGTLAEIRFEAERWRDIAGGSGELVRFIRPRDLDPELGPEE